MQRRYVLWTLNRVADPRWILTLKKTLQFATGVEPLLGERVEDPNWAPPPDKSKYAKLPAGTLMREMGSDEYFVPIPVKCIGNPDQFFGCLSFGSKKKKATSSELAKIKKEYPQYFDDNRGWEEYWVPRKIVSDQFDVRMTTPKGIGYYEVIQKFHEKAEREHPGEEIKHILVGYSQGGLVARYLAFLDEHLADTSIVHAVVTLNAPNYGSPFAHPANSQQVAKNLAELVSVIGEVDHTLGSALSMIVDPQNPSIDRIVGSLDAAIKYFRGRKAAGGIEQSVYEFLKTARKWLSGLQDSSHSMTAEDLAFFDLNIERMVREYSVLACVNHRPLENIKTFTVVGSNSSLRNILGLLVAAFAASGPFGAVANAAYVAKLVDAICRREVEIEAIFRTMFLEQGWQFGRPGLADADARILEFKNGVVGSVSAAGVLDIPPGAHDFVIPSSYQQVPTFHNEPKFRNNYFNYLNPQASHMSGGDIESAGKESLKLLELIFKQL